MRKVEEEGRPMGSQIYNKSLKRMGVVNLDEDDDIIDPDKISPDTLNGIYTKKLHIPNENTVSIPALLKKEKE